MDCEQRRLNLSIRQGERAGAKPATVVSPTPFSGIPMSSFFLALNGPSLKRDGKLIGRRPDAYTHTASSSHAPPTSNELDRVKKPAYFDSARRNRHLLVKNNWFGGITVIIIINRFGPRPPSRKRQRMSAVKTPIIADNDGWNG